MNTLKLQIGGRYPDEEYARAGYMKCDDGWHVNTEAIDGEGWRRYAIPEARAIDVKQLLRKEYDVRY